LHRRFQPAEPSRLRVVLEALPMDCPGIVIVQHMPEKFTEAFARRLNSLCKSKSRKRRTATPCVARAVPDRARQPSIRLLHRSGARYYVTVKDARWCRAIARRWMCCFAPRAICRSNAAASS